MWQSCHVMVQPITHGAGINIKVVEALYNRKPIVATALALRGIALSADPAIVVRDNAGAWIVYLNSPELQALARRKISKENAHMFRVEKNARALADSMGLDSSSHG